MLGWLREGLRDFSVSRAGGSWGIPFPGDPEHRIYVWFDALTNYVTGAGFPDDPAMFERFWPADLHVIGKNITRFHCLYWPAMLMSAGLPLPRQVFAHGFMLLRGEKMSKTRGNVLDPDSAVDLFGVDGIRYLVLREIPFDRDADITLEGLVRRYNADLANDLGNLLNRTVSMANRYLDGQLPALAQTDAEADVDLRAAAARAWDGYRDAMERQHLDEALAAMIDLVRAGNGYAESQAPWLLAKAGDSERLGQVLAAMAETCRILGHLVAPFTPTSAGRLHEQLGDGRDGRPGAWPRQPPGAADRTGCGSASRCRSSRGWRCPTRPPSRFRPEPTRDRRRCPGWSTRTAICRIRPSTPIGTRCWPELPRPASSGCWCRATTCPPRAAHSSWRAGIRP